MSLPELNIKKEGTIRDIFGNVQKFKVSKQVTLTQSDYPEKVFVLQEIIFETSKTEIRIGYYIIGQKGWAKGKWAWGQFCPFFPKKDLQKLITLAKKEGIL